MEFKMQNNQAPMLVTCATGELITQQVTLTSRPHTGVHRSGTFVALDILLRRMQHSHRVAPEATVNHLRSERYGCVQILNHYLFLVESVVQYAISTALHALFFYTHKKTLCRPAA